MKRAKPAKTTSQQASIRQPTHNQLLDINNQLKINIHHCTTPSLSKGELPIYHFCTFYSLVWINYNVRFKIQTYLHWLNVSAFFRVLLDLPSQWRQSPGADLPKALGNPCGWLLVQVLYPARHRIVVPTTSIAASVEGRLGTYSATTSYILEAIWKKTTWKW